VAHFRFRSAASRSRGSSCGLPLGRVEELAMALTCTEVEAVDFAEYVGVDELAVAGWSAVEGGTEECGVATVRPGPGVPVDGVVTERTGV